MIKAMAAICKIRSNAEMPHLEKRMRKDFMKLPPLG